MDLEEIVKLYGYEDYYDFHTGYIYALSEVKYLQPDEDGYVHVPVFDGGTLIGTATMKK